MRRRRFLKSLSLGLGASALSPFFTPWIREAMGQESGAKRVLFFMNTNGTRPDYRPFIPDGMPHTAFDLNAWSPLDRLRDKVIVTDGFYCPFDLHLHGNAWPLTGVKGVLTDGKPVNADPGGPTLDRFLATQMGQETAVDSLSVALWYKKGSNESADGSRKVFPSSTDPIDLFNRIFGAGTNPGMDGMDDRALERAISRDQSVLDFVHEDIRRLETKLAAPEKEKLERYTANLRAMEEQIAKLAASRGTCSPMNPYTPEQVGDNRDLKKEVALDLTMEVIANAFACDLTRVAMVNLSATGEEWVGAEVPVGHKMWHGDGTTQSHTAFYNYNARRIAEFYDRLALIPEGDGTVADNTLIVWLNKNGGNHHNGAYDYWYLTLGDLGGTLKGGQMVVLPREELGGNDDLRRPATSDEAKRIKPPSGDPPKFATNDFFLSIAHAVGVRVDTFGDPRLCTGPIPQLFA